MSRTSASTSTRRPSLSQSEEWGLDTTDARLEVSLMFAINGQDMQVEPKDLGESHLHPGSRPNETQRPDR